MGWIALSASADSVPKLSLFPLGHFMPQCPDLDDLNNLFAVSKNQFDKRLYARFFQENPYMSMFPRLEYDYAEGRIPEVVTSTYELPTEFPIGTSMSTISLSSGTGSSCLIDATTIKSGYTSRNYQLYAKSWDSPVICLTDLRYDWQAVQQINNMVKGLGEYMTRWWAMWYQARIIEMIDTKISTLANCGIDEVISADPDFVDPNLTLPTAELEWCHLQPLYDRLARIGGAQYAVGYSNGMPDYALNIGPGYKRKLWQVDEGVRDTVNWGDAFENFTARGINRAVYGFIPNVDLFPVRYDGSMRYIPPFLNTDASVGRKSISNPAYRTPAFGGNAIYEVFSVTARDIFEVRVAPGGPTSFGRATFSPQNYGGDVRWVNNPDMCLNKRGDLGQFIMDVRVAAKPIFPENGFVGITRALD